MNLKNLLLPTTTATTAPAPVSSPHDTTADDDGGSLSRYHGGFSPPASLISSILNYKYENGRRYHGFGREDAYALPNDEMEQDRLDLYHHIWTALLDGELYTAPVGKPQRILDIGTGTGIWAIDVADKHPQARVIGTDLSPVQPTWVPPNLVFEVDDMESLWVYPKNHFDFIHLRTMANCFADWELLVRQCYDHLKPGGYLEIQDYDYKVLRGPLTNPSPPPADSPFLRWTRLTTTAAERAGRPFVDGHTHPARLSRAGFADVTATWKLWPYSPWPVEPALRELGGYILVGTEQALGSYSTALLTRYMGMGRGEVEALCREVTEELRGRGGGGYWQKAWFVYGRKPGGEEREAEGGKEGEGGGE